MKITNVIYKIWDRKEICYRRGTYKSIKSVQKFVNELNEYSGYERYEYCCLANH